MHRRRRPTRVMTGTALVWAALLATGCMAQVSGAPPTVENTPRPTEAGSPAGSAAPLAGLDARIRQATADAAETGAEIEVAVLDRRTGQTVSNGVNTPFPIASVVKLFIADDVLLQESEGRTELSVADRQALDLMLRSSDDSAAQMFWDRSGQNAVIARIKARYGLTGTTAPYNQHWDVTQSTADDLVRYYGMLLDGSGGLPREQADFILGNLARSTPTGTDGYPQRFGIPEGLYGETVAVKQGWFCCWSGPNQLHVSTGVIGSDRRYAMAITSLDPTSAAAARANITQAVKTMFPDGRI
ncbi:serine hydrolase [Mycobacterium sp. AMU20-3851]|uniref:serine hydrolase n=1 Tax=Mycobacterium sp. AMU20-3851 TaxID=3122055 RepID=UPI0037548951